MTLSLSTLQSRRHDPTSAVLHSRPGVLNAHTPGVVRPLPVKVGRPPAERAVNR